MDEKTLEQIEVLLDGANDKEELLRTLAVRNSADLFEFISQIKWNQDKGFFFGVLHSQYKDVINDAEEFNSICANYQSGEMVTSREFYEDFKEVLAEEFDSQ